MNPKNTTPATIWQALRRLLNCNRTQLAARLGITPRTLHNWEHSTDEGEQLTDRARDAAAELLTASLRAAGNADDLLKVRERRS